MPLRTFLHSAQARLKRETNTTSQPALSSPRRALTAAEAEDGTHGQQHCPIFKLPFEIRKSIYVLVLGDRLIHLGIDDSPTSTRSPRADGTTVMLRRYSCKMDDDVEGWRHPCWYPKGGAKPAGFQKELLSLLVTCRRT